MPAMNLENVLRGSEVLDRLGRRLPHLRHHFTPDQPLHDRSFDSLDLVELLCVIESEFKVSLTEQDLAADTIGELADLIADRWESDVLVVTRASGPCRLHLETKTPDSPTPQARAGGPCHNCAVQPTAGETAQEEQP
jgi:acyl carrier protein